MRLELEMKGVKYEFRCRVWGETIRLELGDRSLEEPRLDLRGAVVSLAHSIEFHVISLSIMLIFTEFHVEFH